MILCGPFGKVPEGSTQNYVKYFVYWISFDVKKTGALAQVQQIDFCVVYVGTSGGQVPSYYVQEKWSFSLSRSTQWRLGEFGGRGPPN